MEQPTPQVPRPPGLAGWVSQPEVIERLQVSRTTLWRWRQEQGLSCSRVGRRVFYSVEEIDRLLRDASGGV